MTTLIGFVLIVYLIMANSSLSRRVRELELKKSGEINKNNIGSVPASSVLDYAQSMPSMATASVAIPVVDQTPNKFVLWLKEDWLMKLGALLFIIGFGWFISYAFINNWVGPLGRISLGIMAGILIMIFGFYRMMKYPSQGAVFLGLGAGMTMLSIFAGRSIYGFFTPALAVMFDFFIAAFAAFASYKFKVGSLAQVAQVLAFVTPLLAKGETNSVFLFSYLLLVSVASLFLASVTGKRALIITGLIFVGMYSLPYIGAADGGMFYGGVYAKDASIVLNFAYVFTMLYLFSGLFAIIKKVEDASPRPESGMGLAILNGLFLFAWVYNVASPEWQSIIFAAWALVFAMSSFVAFKFSSKVIPFYAYGSVAVAFLAAATAMELEGPSLVIAFTMEALLLVLGVLMLTKDTKAVASTSVVFIAPVIMSFSNIMAYLRAVDLFTGDFLALVFIAVALIATGRILNSLQSPEKKDSKEINSGAVFVVLGTFYIGYLLWQFVHILMSQDPDIATMAVLIIYTVFGLLAYFAGLYGEDLARKTYGVVLLAFVIIRLVFVDVWNMELFGRVVTFLVIGVLLMSTAFLTKKKKHE